MAEASLPLPKFNSSATNPKDAWDDFSRCFSSYCTLREFRDYPPTPQPPDQYTENQQQQIDRLKQKEMAALTMALDSEGRKILNYVLTLSEEERKEPSTVLQRFRDHFHGKKHDLFARDICWSAKQEETETVAQWEAKVKLLVNDCNYRNDQSEHCRDRFVIGIRSKSIKQKLFIKGDTLTFEEAVQIAKTSEATEAKMKSEGQVNLLTQKYRSRGPKHAIRNRHKPDKHPEGDTTKTCLWCGDTAKHTKRDCPAQGHRCKKCNKVNHYEKACLTHPVNKDKKHYRVNTVGDIPESDSSSDDSNVCFSVQSPGKHYYTHLKLGPTAHGQTKTVKCLIDTGATCSVMPAKIIKRPELIKHTDPGETVKLYGGSTVQVTAYIDLYAHREKSYSIRFKILDVPTELPLLGGEDAVRLGVVDIHADEVNIIKNEHHPHHKIQPAKRQQQPLNSRKQTTRLLKEYTKRDSSLQELSHYIHVGFPDEPIPSLHEYWPYKEELTVADGVVYKSTAAIIPTELRKRYLKTLHETHQSGEASLARARGVIFWPGMKSEILALSKDCSECAKHNATVQPRKQRSKKSYDKHTKTLPELQVRDHVVYKPPEKGPWREGQITSTGDGPRSYGIVDEHSRYTSRNRRHLTKLDSPFQPAVPDVESEEYRETPSTSSAVASNATPHTSSSSSETKSSQITVPIKTRSGREIKPRNRLIEIMD